MLNFYLSCFSLSFVIAKLFTRYWILSVALCSRCTTPRPASCARYWPCVALTLENDCYISNVSRSGRVWLLFCEWIGLRTAIAQVSIVWTKFTNLITGSGTVVLIPINCRIIFVFAPLLWGQVLFRALLLLAHFLHFVFFPILFLIAVILFLNWYWKHTSVRSSQSDIVGWFSFQTTMPAAQCNGDRTNARHPTCISHKNRTTTIEWERWACVRLCEWWWLTGPHAHRTLDGSV